MIETKQPDARIVGGLFIYILPEHIWGKVPLEELTGAYQPELPLVGSGPYIVTEFERGPDHAHGARTRSGAARSRRSTRSSSSSTAPRTRSSARCSWARSTSSPRSSRRPSSGSASEEGIETVQRAHVRVHRARLQPLLGGELPGRQVQPRGPGPDGPPGDRLRDRPRADQRDRQPGHLVRRPRDPAVVLQDVLRGPRAGLPVRPRAGEPDPRRRRLGARTTTGSARRTARWLSFDLYVRSESPSDDPDGEADRRADAGDRGRVQRPGGQHRQAHRAHGPQGRRQAGAGVRHLHLGLGRRPVRPELPAQPDDHRRDRRLLGRLLLEPRVRPAVRGAADACSTPRSARR